MISPHTKPGTDVIAVRRCPALFGLPGLSSGSIYTVESIIHADADDGGDEFAVVLVGHGIGFGCDAPRRTWRNFWRKPPPARRWAYRLDCFRYVELCGLEALLEARAKARP